MHLLYEHIHQLHLLVPHFHVYHRLMLKMLLDDYKKAMDNNFSRTVKHFMDIYNMKIINTKKGSQYWKEIFRN